MPASKTGAIWVTDAMISTISSWPWSMVAAIFAGLSLLTLWYVNFVRPKLRQQELKRPVQPYFLVPSLLQHNCTYAQQDDDEHILKELSLPPHSEFTIDLIIKVNATISYSELCVGFIGELDKKPFALKYCNRYIKIGRGREVDPSVEDSDDFVDKHLYYHRRVSRLVTVGTVLSLAFTVKTREVGLYPMHFLFVSGDQLGEGNILFITVEETPSIKLRCLEPKHFGWDVLRGE
jgi:hypothetical protein